MTSTLIFSLAAATAAFLWVSSVLPFQNAVALAGLATIGSTAIWVGESWLFPSHPLIFVKHTGGIPDAACGAFALIVCSRGTAKCLLWPGRHSLNAGWWVIALTSLLAWALPFAGWTPLGRLVITPVCLAFGTPWLIDKRRIDPPRDFRPLWIWMAMELATFF
jgi:hypothetical protein